MKTALCIAGGLLLGACAHTVKPPDYPQDWLQPQTANSGCPDLTGIFDDSGESVRAGRRIRESDRLWRLATSLGVNANRVAQYDSIVGPKQGRLTITTWSGNTKIRSRTLEQASDFSCAKGWLLTKAASSDLLVLPLAIIPFNDVLIETRSARYARAEDGSLIVGIDLNETGRETMGWARYEPYRGQRQEK